MNDAAFFVLMLAGMLGYLALIRRTLKRNRRHGSTLRAADAANRRDPRSVQTDRIAQTDGDANTSRSSCDKPTTEERTGGNRPHT